MAADLGHDTVTESDRNSRAFGVLKTPLVDIVGVRLDAPAEVSAALWQLLSRDERERAGKFRYAEHRQHYIVARASLRRLLAERLRIAPRAVEFVETKDRPNIN
jgi:phosphopantetheinyl transferase